MVNRNIQMKKKNNDEWENLFPLSLNENIYNTEGKNLNEQFDQLTNDISNEFLEHEKVINEFKNTTTTQLSNMEDKLENDFNSYKNQVSNQLNIFRKNVPVNHVNSDSYNTLQEAVYAAENGVLHIKKGTYLIDKPIKIKSNTIIFAYGSTFRRNANINNMFINDSNATKGGYNANENIEIIGAVFDGAGGSFSDKCTILAFGHAKNIKIIDSTFKNLRDWHMIELNACQNVLIQNCLFEDYGTSIMGTEMVQIDVAKSTTEFPWFGPYDNTICDNIVIKNNKFINGVRGIGTHSSVENKEHTRITIMENEFRNMSGEAVLGLDWAFTKIHENHFYLVFKGVHLRVQGRSTNNHSIIGNYMAGLPEDDQSRGIQITGVSGGYGLHGGTIKNNKVKRFGSHGIGVDFSNKWIIDGNECQENGKNGIILWGSANITVTGNVSIGNNTSDSNQFDIAVRQSGAEHITITGNTIGTLRVFNDALYTFVTSNTIMNKVDFVHSTTRVLKNNFIGGVFEE